MGYSRLRRNRHGHARYTAYYWDLRGRARSAGTFNRKRDADRAWRRAEAGITEGRFLDLTSGRQRFDRYVTEAWLPGHVMETNTRQGYEYTLRKYLLPEFAPMRMNEIAANHIRGFLARLGTGGASAHTLARCRTVLSAIFTTALNDQVIYFHPCTGVTTPTAPKRPLRILTLDEFAAIVNEALRSMIDTIEARLKRLRMTAPSQLAAAGINVDAVLGYTRLAGEAATNGTLGYTLITAEKPRCPRRECPDLCVWGGDPTGWKRPLSAGRGSS